MITRKQSVSLAVLLLCVCSPVVADDGAAEERRDLWLDAFSTFVVENPALTVEQMDLVWEAVDLATPESFSHEGGRDRWLESRGQRMIDLVTRAEEIFSESQFGQIFSRMGAAQHWLVKAEALATPSCNCEVLHQDCPVLPGVCKTGCRTWTLKNEETGAKALIVGICTKVDDEEEEEEDK